MQVILKKEVQNLGEQGDLVHVKDGYARNYLLPQNYAEIATEGALKNREQNLARLQAKQEKLHQEALAKAAEIEKVGTLELAAKAGESGHGHYPAVCRGVLSCHRPDSLAAATGTPAGRAAGRAGGEPPAGKLQSAAFPAKRGAEAGEGSYHGGAAECRTGQPGKNRFSFQYEP